MRQVDLSGLIAREVWAKTVRVPNVRVPNELVCRQFRPDAPHMLVCRQPWPTRRELIGEILEYIEAFYNH